VQWCSGSGAEEIIGLVSNCRASKVYVERLHRRVLLDCLNDRALHTQYRGEDRASFIRTKLCGAMSRAQNWNRPAMNATSHDELTH
jgi:hypothetical protein